MVAGVGFSDNVFGTTTGKQSDVFAAIDPSVTVRSDWNRNSLSASAGGTFRKYASHSTEDETGGYGQVDGQYDIDHDDYLNGEVAVRHTFEERDSGGYPVGAAAPVTYDQSTAFLRATRDSGRLRGVFSTDIQDLNYDAVSSLSGGTISQAFRDREIYRTSSRGEFAFTPDTSTFLQLTFLRSDYKYDVAPGVENRSSDGARILVGGALDISALVRGYFGIGVETRQFDSNMYGDATGVSADALIQFFPTQLITFTLNAHRFLEDSVILNSGVYFDTNAAFRVDYELLRSLLLNAHADYDNDQYDRVDRDDKIYVVGGGGRYMINRNFGLKADVSYVDRTSSGTVRGLEFDETKFLVSLVFQR